MNCSKHLAPSVKYITDTKEHGHLGFDDALLPLNYFGTFLIECGFPVDKAQIMKYLPLKRLPIAVHDYLVNYLETPKSLMGCCRDALRRRFIGRNIHRYVEISNCPKKIKDFILMKQLLFPRDF